MILGLHCIGIACDVRRVYLGNDSTVYDDMRMSGMCLRYRNSGGLHHHRLTPFLRILPSRGPSSKFQLFVREQPHATALAATECRTSAGGPLMRQRIQRRPQ